MVVVALAAVLVATTFAAESKERGTQQPKLPSWAEVSDEQIAEAKKLGVPVAFVNETGIKFVLAPAGEFLMGSADDEVGRYEVEGPQHRVEIQKPFYVAIHQVTQGQWKSLMGNEPWVGKHSNEYSQANDPANVATWVNWDDATNFCARLTEKDGRPYRLLTEAEWEYSCRAGSTTRFCYGDDLKAEKLSEYAWWGSAEYHKQPKEEKYVRPPGLKKPNNWGLYDVHGMVWEMCLDIMHPNYDGAPTDGRAWMGGAPTDKEPAHPLRGGGSHSTDRRCRTASRYSYRQSASSHYVGFRVCCQLK